MRPAKIREQDLIDRLLNVFRTHGFEGASLSRLAEATGLKRASLYHRFPGGKDEMARVVADWVDRWFADHVFAPLVSEGDPARRVQGMVEAIDRFYEGGRHPCLLESLSLGEGNSPLHRQVRRSWIVWQEAMESVAIDAGLEPAEARHRAEDALIGIEGALILNRVTGNASPFKRVLRRIPALLTSV